MVGTVGLDDGGVHIVVRRVSVVLEAPVDLPLRDLVGVRVRVGVWVRARVVVGVRVGVRVKAGVRIEVRVRVSRSAAPVPRRAAGREGSAG